jgi:hypothetical protein
MRDSTARNTFNTEAARASCKLGLGVTLALIAAASGTAKAASGTDWDGDFVDDGLELTLAQQFFPNMNMNCGSFGDSVHGSQGQFYGTDIGEGLTGRLPFTAHIYADGRLDPCGTSGRCIEIRYGMAYNWDLGDDVFGGGHPGDTEMVSLLLATDADWGTANNDPSVWRIMKIYRTAHACADGDSSSFQDWNSSAIPEDWVAEGKNSNYSSEDSCSDGGFLNADDCVGDRCWINRDFATTKLTNAGEFGDPTIGDGGGHIPRSRFDHGFTGYSSADAVIPAPGGPTANSIPSGNYDVWGALSFGEAGTYCRHLTRFLDWASGAQSCNAHPDCP